MGWILVAKWLISFTMTFKLLFSLYITFILACVGFLDQDAGAKSLNNEISVQLEVSDLAVSVLPEHKQESEKNKNCPESENCNDCFHCCGHCCFILSSFNIEQSNFSDSILSVTSKTLASRDLDSLFRPPIFA